MAAEKSRHLARRLGGAEEIGGFGAGIVESLASAAVAAFGETV